MEVLIRFWQGMVQRAGLKRSDKILVGNSDTGTAQYVNLNDLLSALNTDDLQPSATRLYLSTGERTKIESLISGISATQAAAAFYPRNSNPSAFLNALSNIAAAQITGVLAAGNIPDISAAKITAGLLNAARIPNLPATTITSGVFAIERIPDIPASKITGLMAQIGDFIPNAARGTAEGVAPLDEFSKVNASYIGDLDASKIKTGKIAIERLPEGFGQGAVQDLLGVTQEGAFTDVEITAAGYKTIDQTVLSLLQNDGGVKDLAELATAQSVNDILAILASDDTTLDELQEVVSYIKANRDIFSNLSVANIAGLEAALLGKAADSSVIHKTGDEVKDGRLTITGLLTLSESMVIETSVANSGGVLKDIAYYNNARSSGDKRAVIIRAVNDGPKATKWQFYIRNDADGLQVGLEVSKNGLNINGVKTNIYSDEEKLKLENLIEELGIPNIAGLEAALENAGQKLPPARKGQLYFNSLSGSTDVLPADLVKIGSVVDSQEDFDIASTQDFSLARVFQDWKLFSHVYGGGALRPSPPNFPGFADSGGSGTGLTEEEFYNNNVWKFDADLNSILLNRNFSEYTGFISPSEYENYTLQATISSDNIDNDHIGVVVAFFTDPQTGYEHSISVLRSFDANQSYTVFYNFHQENAVRLFDLRTLAPGSGNWSTQKTAIRAVRTGNQISVKTAQYTSGTPVIDDSTEQIIDLDQNPLLQKFKGASAVGFSAKSQINSTFSNIIFTGFTDYIFWKRNGSYDVYQLDNTTDSYNLESPRQTSISEVFKLSPFIINDLTGKTFYISPFDEIKAFGTSSDSIINPGTPSTDKFGAVSSPQEFDNPFPFISINRPLNGITHLINLNVDSWRKRITNPIVKYCDQKNGSDANDGNSWSTAYKTMGKIRPLVFDRAYFAHGNYASPLGIYYADKEFISVGGKSMFVNGYLGTDKTWSDEGAGVFSTDVSQTIRVIVDTEQLEGTRPLRLSKKSSLAEMQSSSNCWFKDSNNILHLKLNGESPSKGSIAIALSYMAMTYPGKTLYSENIDFLAGIKATATADQTVLLAKNCDFFYCNYNNGLTILGNIKFFFDNCRAYRNIDDGFNYHEDTGFNPYGVEYYCEGYENGEGNNNSINNGSTLHENARIIRIGGTYHSTEGPVVHDVGTSQSWNVDCVSYNSQSVNPSRKSAFAVAAIPGDTAKMWLDGCVTKDDGTYGIEIRYEGSVIYAKNSIIKNPSPGALTIPY